MWKLLWNCCCIDDHHPIPHPICGCPLSYCWASSALHLDNAASQFGSRSDCAHTKQHFHLHLVKLLKSHLYIFIVQCLFWVGYSRLLQLLLYLIYLNARGVTSCYVTTLVLPDSRSGIQSRKLFCNRLHSQCRAVCAPNHCGLHRLYCVVLLTEKKFMFPVICDQCTQ